MKQLEQIYSIKAPISKVWQALTDAATAEQWGAAPAKVDAREGGEFSYWDGDIHGIFTKLVPEKLIEQDWYGHDNPTWKYNVVFIFKGEGEGEATTVRMVYSGNVLDEQKDIADWRDYYFDPIKKLLEAGPGMKTAIVLHGKPDKEEYYDKTLPSESNSHWLPWLQKQLAMRDIVAQTPEMPRPYEPGYGLWQKEFERYDITPDTLLVGHSCGGGFIVRWLSEHPDVTVGKVVLVAPSLGIDWDDRNFFDFTIDPDLVTRTAGVTIFGSDNDWPAVIEAIKRYRAAIKGVKYRGFKGYGHFVSKDMHTREFPELLEEILHG